MTKPSLIFIVLTAVLITGCTSAIHAVTKEPMQPDPSTTTIGTDVDDWQMATLIGVNIKKADPQLERSHINVHTHNRIVLLTGEVPSAELRTLAGDTARRYRDVRQVYNELAIQGSTSFLARTSDSWITTKLKSMLLANRDVKGTRVKVVTENGVVYLMGLVTRREADTISNIASNTRGVHKVVRVFEYID